MSEQQDPSGSQPVELVRALQEGDREAFATLYELYADRIYTYCVSICRNQDWAADAMQDAFMLAFARISQLRDPSKLRPWLYAVARNECLRQLRVHRREADLDAAGEVVDMTASTDGDLDAADARSLIGAAFLAMNTGDRDVLDLALRQDLDNASIASVLKVSENNASAKVSRAKAQLETTVGALLLFRSRGSNCAKLKESMGSETDFNVLSRKRIARHAQECDDCSRTKKRAIAAIAMAGLPLLAAPTSVRDFLIGTAAPDTSQLTASDYSDLGLESSAGSDAAGETTYINSSNVSYTSLSMPDRAAQLDKSRPSYDKDGWPVSSSTTKHKPKALFAVAGVALVALMGSAFVFAIGNNNQQEQAPDGVIAVAATPTAEAAAAKAPAPAKVLAKPTAKPTTTPSPGASLDAGADAGDTAAGPNKVANPPQPPKKKPPKRKPAIKPAPPAPGPAPRPTRTPAPPPAPAPTPGGPGPGPGGPPGLVAPTSPIPQ